MRGRDSYLIATLEWDSMVDLRAALSSPQGRATAEDMTTLTQLSDVQRLIYEQEDV